MRVAVGSARSQAVALLEASLSAAMTARQTQDPEVPELVPLTKKHSPCSFLQLAKWTWKVSVWVLLAQSSAEALTLVSVLERASKLAAHLAPVL